MKRAFFYPYFKKMHIRLLFILTLVPLTALHGQTENKTFQLFSISDVHSRAHLPADERDRVYITLNSNLFSESGADKASFRIPRVNESLSFTFDQIDHNLRIKRLEQYFPGTISFIAVDTENGSTLIATLSEDRITAKYHDHYSNTLKHIRYDEDISSHYLATIQPQYLGELSCGHDDLDHSSIPQISSEYRESSQKRADISSRRKDGPIAAVSTPILSGLSVSGMAGSLYDSTTIDILYVYTQAAEDFAKNCRVNQSTGCESVNNIEELLSQATILSQTALDNSQIPIKLRPVFAYKTDYDETKDEVTSGKRLQRLTTSAAFNPSNWNAGGFMEEVHEYRDQYGADLVAGIFSVSDVGGIAWLLNSPGGYPEIGFSLNRVQQVLSGYTLIHEIGHNLGNAHSRTQTANAASIYGGLFHYSVGYQWVTETEAFSSVMAYQDRMATLNGDTVRSVEAPVFSSPDVTWSDSQAGTLSEIFGPTNAAQSNREIKQAVSNYRMTKLDPPVTDFSVQEIVSTMNREDTFVVPVTISNSGNSDLMWQISTTDQGMAKQTQSVALKDVIREEDREVDELKDYDVLNFAQPRSNIFAKADESGVIYSEDFENFKSKIFGGYQALGGWRTDDVKNMFQIKTTAPSTGKNHMRIEAGVSSAWYIESPFFGPQGVGVFEMEFDLSVTKDPNTNGFTYFGIQLYDASTGQLTAGMAVNNLLSILAFTKSETGEVILRDTGEDLVSDATSNTYRKLKIRLNTTSKRLEYYVDGKQEIGSALLEGISVDHFYLSIAGEQHPKSLIDLDNLVIKRPYLFDWLDIADYAGTVRGGEEEEIQVIFNTKGISPGTYSTILQVMTNDPLNSVQNIPVTLTVNSTVPVEENSEIPVKPEISSIYPNPFNPSTTIDVNLPTAGFIELSVYDVTGRKIAQITEGVRAAGRFTVTWDASLLSSGLYFVRLQSEGQFEMRAITLLK